MTTRDAKKILLLGLSAGMACGLLSARLAALPSHAPAPTSAPTSDLVPNKTSDTSHDKAYAEQLSAARTAYFKVVVSNDHAADEQAHALLTAMNQSYPGDAVVKAYRGSLELLDAAHDWQIWRLHQHATEGLALLDEAVSQAPNAPEARFIRAATSLHLPALYHRRAQCEADFALLAQHAASDARDGRMPPELAAATMNYWGQILVSRHETSAARAAFQSAVRIAPQSPGARDAARHLQALS